MSHHFNCPYCGREQKLESEEVYDESWVGFFEPMEEPIITDSFSEHEGRTTCKFCGKDLHFMYNNTSHFAKEVLKKSGLNQQHPDE